ncbi:unnamed protein product [Trifolium pratense]|uniref:Uncharacterized protein n=1 Tax=Trifolium pratense TaxID=57577 RepID=A0ACB0LMD2_TRIPR|nr:unnamed protein product [Trifolium pratense]
MATAPIIENAEISQPKSEKDKWLENIQALLISVDHDYIQSCSISVVPERLKIPNEYLYMPRVVSIGPRFMKSREELLLMEEVKLRCMLSVLHRGEEKADISFDKCSSVVWELDEVVRASYVVEFELTQPELAKIILLDGCFLLELLISNSKKLNSKFPSRFYPPCPTADVLKDEDVLSDLMLFENQIPILVLHKLYQTIFPNVFEQDMEEMVETEEQRKKRAKKINNLALSVLGYSSLEEPSFKSPHFLDLVHFFVNKTFERRVESGDNLKIRMPDINHEKLKVKSCALRLGAAGVSIQVIEDIVEAEEMKGLDFEFKFNNGKLKISKLNITKTTKARWRNLIAWEHHKYNEKSSETKDQKTISPRGKFTSSALIFDGLICCEADLNFLKTKKIIVDHTNMSNEELKEFFRTMSLGVDPGVVDSTYVTMVAKLNNYSSKSFFILGIFKLLWHLFTIRLEWFVKFLKRNYNFVAMLILLFGFVRVFRSDLLPLIQYIRKLDE